MALSVLRQSNILRRNVLFSNISIRKISTSQPRNIHPLITLFAKPISRVAAAILGRSARAYWKKLPQSKKDAFKIQVSKYRWLSIPGMALAVIGPTYGYYSVSTYNYLFNTCVIAVLSHYLSALIFDIL